MPEVDRRRCGRVRQRRGKPVGGNLTQFQPDFIAFYSEQAHLSARTMNGVIYFGVLLVSGLIALVFTHAIVVGISDGIDALTASR